VFEKLTGLLVVLCSWDVLNLLVKSIDTILLSVVSYLLLAIGNQSAYKIGFILATNKH